MTGENTNDTLDQRATNLNHAVVLLSKISAELAKRCDRTVKKNPTGKDMLSCGIGQPAGDANEFPLKNATGVKNTAVGVYTAARMTTGEKNSAFGYKTMWKNEAGKNNAAFGYETMQENTGNDNAAFGKEALADSVGNTECVAIGYKAGYGVHDSLHNLDGEGKPTGEHAEESYKGEIVPKNPQNQIMIGANALSRGNNTTVLGNKNTGKTYIYGNSIVLCKPDGEEVEVQTEEHHDDEVVEDKFIMDAKMSDIPKDGVISTLLIFRNNPLNVENMTLTKKQGTLGSILVIGNDSQQYGDFTDFKSVPGLESIAPASKFVQHKMNNVILRGLGNNTDDKDINALTLVNLSSNHQFSNISVMESEDDGVEIFGGSVNMSNITVADAKDDYFDTDHGHSGTISNLKLYQSSNWRGKSLIECGNKKGSTTTKFTNLTFNNGLDVSKYSNNGSDKNFNIKSGSVVEINGQTLTEPQDEISADVVAARSAR